MIRHEDPGLRQTFEYLVEHAAQAFPIRKTLSYRVHGRGPFEILEEQDRLDTAETRDGVLNIIYTRVHRRVIERFVHSGWVTLHGALATVNGRRTLLLGSKGAGKTTLALRLLYQGHQVEGDEMVFVRRGSAVALPRPFHIKPRTEQQVPEIASLLNGLPRVLNGPNVVTAFDPAKANFAWTIRLGPIDRLVWLVPNHGGVTALTKKLSFEAVHRIVENTFGWGEARSTVVSEASMLGAGGGYELLNGNPWKVVRLLET